MKRSLNDLSIKLSNGLTCFDNDLLTPPSNGIDPLPDGFPATVLEIRTLEAGEYLSAIENYYNLNHGGLIQTRRRRVAFAYGAKISI